MVFLESGLNGVKVLALGQTFNGGDRCALGLHGEHGARLDRLTVHMNRASSALRRLTSHMRSGQSKIVAQKLHEQGSAFDGARNRFSVHRHRHVCHGIPAYWNFRWLIRWLVVNLTYAAVLSMPCSNSSAVKPAANGPKGLRVARKAFLDEETVSLCVRSPWGAALYFKNRTKRAAMEDHVRSSDFLSADGDEHRKNYR